MAWVLALVGLALLAAIHELVRRLAAKRWRHAIANALGAVAHYIAIAALSFAYAVTIGLVTDRHNLAVVEVMPGYDAVGELERGDHVLAVDGRPLGNERLTERVNAANGRPVLLSIRRAAVTRDVQIQPRAGEGGRWLLGIKVRREAIYDRALGGAARWAVTVPALALADFARDTQTLVAGRDEPEAGGPMRIVEEFVIEMPLIELAMSLIVRAALAALLVQLVVNVLRSRRR